MKLKLALFICLTTASLQNHAYTSHKSSFTDSENPESADNPYFSIGIKGKVPRIDDALTAGEIKAEKQALDLYENKLLNPKTMAAVKAQMKRSPSMSITLLVHIGEQAQLIDQNISAQKDDKD